MRIDLPTWFEFHDSTLSGLNRTTTDLEVLVDAFVHRWDLVGDDWIGTGWMQPVRIRITNAGGQSSAKLLPIDISNGRLQVGTVTHSNLIPLSLNESETIKLWIELTNADVLHFVGDSVQIEALGEARFVEDLPANLRPDLKSGR